MKPNRVKNDQKVPEPNKNEIIEPIVYGINSSAVTYGVDWAGTVEIDGIVGWWRSNQRTRPHHDSWKYQIETKHAGRVFGNSYYFSQEEGKKACGQYRERVLSGELRARQDSWTNSHAEATKTSFQALRETYPQLYKAPSVRERDQSALAHSPRGAEGEVEIANEAHLDMRAEELPDIVPEETMASAVAVEEQFGMYQYEEEYDVDHTQIFVGGYMNTGRFSEDKYIIRMDDNKDHEFYRVYVPRLDRWILTELGTYVLDGVKFTVSLDGDDK